MDTQFTQTIIGIFRDCDQKMQNDEYQQAARLCKHAEDLLNQAARKLDKERDKRAVSSLLDFFCLFYSKLATAYRYLNEIENTRIYAELTWRALHENAEGEIRLRGLYGDLASVWLMSDKSDQAEKCYDRLISLEETACGSKSDLKIARMCDSIATQIAKWGNPKLTYKYYEYALAVTEKYVDQNKDRINRLKKLPDGNVVYTIRTSEEKEVLVFRAILEDLKPMKNQVMSPPLIDRIRAIAAKMK